MERANKGSSNFIKHQSSNNGGRNVKEINLQDSCNKVKSLWDLSSECHGTEADLLGLFSWPPRSYTCTFCKREFRSAQALGGHMNVHRRDRARLRQSPPPRDHHGPYSLLNLNLDPNPNFPLNPNPSLSSSAAKSPSILSLPSLIPPSVSTISTTPPATVIGMRKFGKADFAGLSHSSPMSSTQDLVKSKASKRIFELEKLGSIMHEKETSAALNKSDIVRLELEIGLLGEVKEDLDLELRLGYI